MNNDRRVIVFFDGYCELCYRALKLLARLDKRHLLFFSPLQGELAKQFEKNEVIKKQVPGKFADSSSLLVIKNEKHVFFQGKAVFEALWETKGWRRILAWPKFLPSVFYNWAYREVAKRRCRLNDPKLNELKALFADRYID